MKDDVKDPPRENLFRSAPPADLEERAEDGTPIMRGHFAVFNQWTEIDSAFEGHFLERIAPGAFKKTFKENGSRIRSLFQHGRDPQIGDKPLGTVETLREDDQGAYYEVRLLDAPYVNEQVLPGLRANLYGASFRFGAVKEDFVRNPGVSDYNPKGLPERTLIEMRVPEFGPVTFGAYENATAGVRSLTDKFRVADFAVERLGVGDWPKIFERVDAEDMSTLATMIQYGSDYIADQDEPDDRKNVPVMESILKQLSELVQVEAAEEEPDEPDELNAAALLGETRSPLTSKDVPPNLKPEPGKKPTPPVKDDEPEHSQESRSTPEPDKQEAMSEQTEEKTMERNEYNTVEEIDARLVEIESLQNEMSTEWGVRKFDADTQTRWDEMIDEKNELTSDRSAYLERKAYLETQAKQKDRAREPGAGAASVVANRNAAPENIFDLAEYHTRSTSQEHMGRLLEDGAKRAVDGFRFPSDNPQFDQEYARSAAQDILDKDSPDKEIAQRMLVHGSPVYRSAFWKTLAKQPLSQEEQRKMHEGMMLESRSLTAAGDGGITVPVQIDPTVILASTGVINPFRQVARIVRTTSYQWQGVTSTGITAQYRAEGAAMTDNSPTLLAPTINPERADAFVPFTWEAAQDWGSLESEMASLFSDAKDVLEATKFASGAGHGSNEPLGVLTASGTVVGTSATTTVGTVDIYALEAALPVRFQPNAVWLATPALFSRVRIQAAAGNNAGGIWADSLQVGQPARLLGYPAYKASTVGTAGNQAVSVASTTWGIFGDFSKFAIVDRIGFQVRPIENLFNGNTAGGIAYPNGMSGLVCYWRNSSGVLTSNAFRRGTIT